MNHRDFIETCLICVNSFALCVLASSAADTNLISGATLPKNISFKDIEARWSAVPGAELRNSAQAGLADAQMYFGSTEWKAAYQDNRAAFKWNLRATKNGVEPTAEEQEASRNKWQNVSEAELRKAANSDDRSAQLFLGKLETERAFARAREGFAWMKKAADQSLVVAEEEMAIQYLGLSGWFVIPSDESEGMKWLQRAADHGSNWAENKLADFLLSGRHGPPDPVAALDHLRKAADKNRPRAQYELAMLYANGVGEPRNPNETPTTLIKSAAQAGYNRALVALADRYRTGFGVDRNFIQSIRLYHAAAEIDARVDFAYNSGAESYLDILNEKLEPKPRIDPNLARFAQVLSRYRKAIEHQDASAMFEIGQSYLRGADVPKDSVEAYKWMAVAADRGSLPAAQARDEIKASLSAEDLKKGEEVFQEFKSSSP